MKPSDCTVVLVTDITLLCIWKEQETLRGKLIRKQAKLTTVAETHGENLTSLI